MKSFKTHVPKICKDEYGYLVLVALFDTVDDTKLVGKIILEVKKHEVACSKFLENKHFINSI